MNKNELIAKIALNGRMTKKDAKKFLELFIETVSTSLNDGNSIQLFGFGTFTVFEKKAHKGYNPKTMEQININAKKIVKFKAGKSLLSSVNRNKDYKDYLRLKT